LSERQLSRRRFLAGAGAIAGSAALGGFAGSAITRGLDARDPQPSADSQDANSGLNSAGALEPFFGPHQSGVMTARQLHGAFAAFSLVEGFNREAATRLFRVVTENASKLVSGTAPLSDNDPELASGASRLTITAGIGVAFFRRIGLESMIPEGFVDIPAYDIDRLESDWSGGDFLLQIGSDDPVVLAHALRHMTRSIRSFAQPKWVQRGFTGTPAVSTETGTSRNLMGQVDGTVNPRSEQEFDAQVWAPTSTGWFAGGTMLVLRRIAMTLDTWDSLDTTGKELAVGRKLSTGAPLTGDKETDVPDFTAVGSSGLPVIPPFAHIRRARFAQGSAPFLRRPFNFDDGINLKGEHQAGLIFAAYAANIESQYIPVQNALAKQDLLNRWTIPVGSAVFAILPGCLENGLLGESLLRWA